MLQMKQKIIEMVGLNYEEELRYYFDLLVSRYCLTDKEYNIEESESEEDIDEAIDELKHEINELKEIQ